MLEQIQQFFSENTTVVIMAVVALVSIVAFFLLRRNTGVGSGQQEVPYPTPSHDMEGMETMGTVCDMASGMCQPQDNMQQQQQQQMTPEQEQQMMVMQQQMMQQQMMAQQQGEQGVEGEQTTNM